MSQPLKTALRVKLHLLAAMVILAAVFILALRFSVWLLPSYQDTVKSWMSNDSYQTDFERLQVKWEYGLPQLSIYGLSVTPVVDAQTVTATRAQTENEAEGDTKSDRTSSTQTNVESSTESDVKSSTESKADEFLAIDRAEAQIDWWRTLLNQRPVLSDLAITGVNARLRLALLDTSAFFAKSPEQNEALPSWLHDLALQKRISLTSGAIELLGAQQRYELLLNGEFNGTVDGLVGRLAITNSEGDSIDVRVQLELHDATTSGQLYADVSTDALAYWQPVVLAQWPNLARFDAGGKVWVEWQNNQPSQISADLYVEQLRLDVREQPVFVNELALRLRAAKKDENWSFIAQPSQGRINYSPIPVDRVAGQWSDKQLLLNIETLDLGILHRLANLTPHMPESVTREIAVLAPTGLLKNIRAELNLETLQQEAPEVLLNADVVGVSVEAYDGAPKIDNIQGKLSHDQESGIITFDSAPLMLSFPDLFSAGWGFDRASGTVLWKFSPGKIWVESDHLQVEMPEITANGRFSLDLAYAKGVASDFSLMIGTEQANGVITPKLIPDKELNPDLTQWLSQGIQQGTVNKGLFVYHGPLESWAEDPSIQLYFDVNRAKIKYSPDWPAVQQVNGQVLVKDSAVLATTTTGKTFATQLARGRFYLADGADVLAVSASMSGPAADVKSVLMNSPVAERLGAEFAEWDLTGKTSTELSLQLNLADIDNSRYQVTSKLSEGRYLSKKRDLVVEEINGTFVYDDQQGLNASGIKARFFDSPVLVRIDTQTSNEETHTVVRADGNIEVARLNQWLDIELLKLFEGSSGYSAFLDVCTSEKRDCSSLRLTSSLEGVQTRLLPPPFAKQKDEAMPFELRTELEGDTNWMRIKLANQLNSLLLINDQGLQGGDIVLGVTNELPQQRKDGLWVRGFLQRVVLSEWQALADEYADDAVGKKGVISIDPLLNTVDLAIANLQLSEDMALQQVNLGFNPESNGRLLTVSSPSIKGDVFLPTEPKVAYNATFDRLYLPRKPQKDEQSSADGLEDDATDPWSDMDPGQLPSVRVHIRDFRHGDRQLGEWKIAVDPSDEGVEISHLSGVNKAFKIEGAAEWIKQQGAHMSRVNLSFSSDQLANAQKLFGIAQGLEAEKAKIDANLFWKGSPLGYNTKTMSGDVHLSAGKGRFMDVGSASALRVFGILNLNTIGRRLRLDFSDLSEAGLSFDKILGHYRLDNGIAKSTEPLKFTGPSADIELTGLINLPDETLQQRMRVTLPLSDSLPLTALLLGTPQVAGAMFLFDKLTGSKLSKITTTVYDVTGAWDDPKIEPVKSNNKQEAAK